MNIDTIVGTMHLIDFFERKNNTIMLSDGSEMNKLRAIDNKYLTKHNKFSLLEPCIYRINEDTFANYLQYFYPVVYKILLIANGKISLCGPSVLDVIENRNHLTFDLYFHSCSIQECYDLFVKFNTKEVTFYKNYLDINLENYVIRIYYTIYDTKENVLNNISMIPLRHGWNPTDRYFCTFNALLSIVMNASPLNLSTGQVIKDELDLMEATACRSIRWISHNFHNNCSFANDIYVIRVYNYLTNNILYIHKSENSLELDEIIDASMDTLMQLLRLHLPSPIVLWNKFFTNNFIKVGIDDNRYVEFSKISSKFNLPKELFRMLCDYWLRAEAYHARDTLLSAME